MPLRKEILSRINWREDEEKGDVGVGTGGSSEFIVPEETGRAPLKDLEWFYWNFGPLFRGINLKAASLWGRGFTIDSDNEDDKKLCEDATLNMAGFKQWVITESTHALIYGGGPGEIIWDDENKVDNKGNVVKVNDFIVKIEEGKNITGYNITDPKTFKANWDDQGYINFWKQKVVGSGGKEIITNHKERKICNFKFFQIADNVNGIGLVEVNLPTIKGLMNSQKSTNELLFRHGTPFVHVTKDGASAKDVVKLKKIGEKFSNSTNLASSEKIKIELIGIKGKSVDIQPHITQLQDNLAGGLGIPKAILFAAGDAVNRATLTELLTMSTTEIKTYQEKLSDIFENQIFVPLLKAQGKEFVRVPQIKWLPLDEKGKAEILINFKTLSESMAKLASAGIYTAEESKAIMEKNFKDTLTEEGED